LTRGPSNGSFNPVYVPGMTVAAQAAVRLDEQLRAHPGTFGRVAQEAVARCREAPRQARTRPAGSAGTRRPLPAPGCRANTEHGTLDTRGSLTLRSGST